MGKATSLGGPLLRDERTRFPEGGRKVARLFIRDSKGQAMVEFALLLPLMLILLGGVTDFGLALFVSNAIGNAARDGTRIAATLQGVEAEDSRVLAAVNSRIPDSSIFASFRNGGSTTVDFTGVCPDARVTVAIQGTYDFLLLRLINTFLGGGFPESLTLARSTTARWERQPLKAEDCL